MKPKKLTLKNFGPFIDETIDFSKLTDAPLFLITGKTGAGKTTIFDGMTYALSVSYTHLTLPTTPYV